MAWQWHQLDHMQVICTSLQTPAPHHAVFTGWMILLPLNQQHQITEGYAVEITTTAVKMFHMQNCFINTPHRQTSVPPIHFVINDTFKRFYLLT